MEEKITAELLNVLENSEKIEDYFSEIEESSDKDFLTYFNEQDQIQNINKADLIRDSQIDRTYAYQILQGRKNPSRDKIIALCLAGKFTLLQCQRALSYGKEAKLYPKIKRDAVIIFAFNKSLSVSETEELLNDFKLDTLNKFN